MIFKHLKYASIALAALSAVGYAQKVKPTLETTKYTFTVGPMVFQATLKNAGRIQSLKYSTNEVLHQDTNTATNYGSTFWPSPQAGWKNNPAWPPATNLDGTGAYTVSMDDTSVTFVGMNDASNHLRIRKVYSANLGDSTFNMRYTLVNTNTTSASWAPWEDTRIPAGGLYLFPKGDTAVTGQLPALTKDSIGMTWFKYDSTKVPTSGTNKFYTDGHEGWFAHIDPRRTLFIKKFSDSPLSKKAPGVENEIELYTDNSKKFIEMEAQGSYGPIAAGDSIAWDMKWYVRKIPDTMTVALGNKAIVDYIHAVLNAAPTSLKTSAASQSFALNYLKNHVTLNLEKNSNVSLSLVNSRGQEVSRIHSGPLAQGMHDFAVNAALPKGIYWLMLKNSDQKVLNTRMVVRL